MANLIRFVLATLFLSICSVLVAFSGHMQDPVFNQRTDINQEKLLRGCVIATDKGCAYSLREVLNSGGHFWTTPFQPYDAKDNSGDGYGEGPNGPRSDQRKAFLNITDPRIRPSYPFLRLNGLDSQSCFECHNSTGSRPVKGDNRAPMNRQPYGVAGSAGSNSNAFINPLYPKPQTLFIRNPPAVFGSGYQQAVAEEMTIELLLEREHARRMAKLNPGKAYDQSLSAKGVSFGHFITVYEANTPAKVQVDAETCPAGLKKPQSIGGVEGYTDDLTKLDGVSCDLVIRPFQWKGIASGLRHFVRDALDFHFSMQAFEKVGLCDCDGDGKGTPTTGPEVTIGQVTAMVSFVGMTRPPVQLPLTTESQRRGQSIFFGKVPGLYQNMCANCHVGPQKLLTPNMLVEWPTNPADETAAGIDPGNPDTWPVKPQACPHGTQPAPNACPVESSYSAASNQSFITSANRGALVSPLVSSQQLSIIHRFALNSAKMKTAFSMLSQPTFQGTQMSSLIRQLRSPLGPQTEIGAKQLHLNTSGSSTVVGQDYVIPLSVSDSDVTAFQFPRLAASADGTVDVPLFSDLKRHNMGKFLSDPTPPLPSQGTDVADINTTPADYMTRPLWGVADTGPWLHDGRALTLKQAILEHGDSASGSGSDAAPVIDAFEKLSDTDQQAVINFLLTLRLPAPGGVRSRGGA